MLPGFVKCVRNYRYSKITVVYHYLYTTFVRFYLYGCVDYLWLYLLSIFGTLLTGYKNPYPCSILTDVMDVVGY